MEDPIFGGEVAQIAEQRRKRDLAGERADQIKRQIENTEDFAPDRAVLLAGTWVSYRMERLLHSVDARRGEISIGKFSDPEQQEMRAIKARDFHNERIRFEIILRNATMGNFQGLKEFIAQEGSNLQRVGRGNSDKERIANRWIDLANAIPNEGQPFIPPPPAWADPNLSAVDHL